jgi:hypothetical protein
MNIKTVLESLKDAFTQKLDENITLYKCIGSSIYESPIWLQLDAMYYGEDGIRFRSSQNFNIAFILECDKLTIEWIKNYHEKAYEYFKYLKYAHIRDNHPTVWQDVFENEIQKDRVISFVNNYQFA